MTTSMHTRVKPRSSFAASSNYQVNISAEQSSLLFVGSIGMAARSTTAELDGTWFAGFFPLLTQELQGNYELKAPTAYLTS